MNKVFIFDIEADGLLDDKKSKKATKIHCLSIGWYDESGKFKKWSTTKYNLMKEFFLNPNYTVAGHNVVLYDIILIERLLNIKAKCKIIDTLGLSWYVSPQRNEHSLESYAIEYGLNKIEINDWDNLPSSEYVRRCEGDLDINNILYNEQKKHLYEIYDNDQKAVDKLINYISFKLDCFKEQQELGLKFDRELAEKTLKSLLEEKEKKIALLIEGMPKNPIKAKKTIPKKMYNSKSELSSNGLKWNAFLKQQGLPISYIGEIEYIKGYETPNPNSHTQVKEWLFGLGWKPQYIKHNRNKKTGEISRVPQIKSQENDGNLCPSVLKLIEKTPALEYLNGLSVINHRIGVFEGFLRDEINDRLYQNIGGLTNTLRAQHRILTNLVKSTEPYGKEIRGCLIADNENTLLCNSDLTGLEETTKHGYMYKYDPKYVIEMRTEGFDPHLDVAVRAGIITEEQSNQHKLFKATKGKEGKDYTSERFVAKTTNFACVYGAYPKRIALTANVSLSMAEKLFEGYWERNKAVNQVADDCIVKTIRGQMWLYNPISKLWYSLRNEKDRFSTLNQGTAVYVFDIYLGFVRKQIPIPFQYHDELMFNTQKIDKERVTKILQNAMKQTNDLLKLNVPISCGIEFGSNYSACH